jgi:hypothetical protein
MTIHEQAQQLETSYGLYHRTISQRWRTSEDKQEALSTLKGHLREAERTLHLTEMSETSSARASLVLWCEMTKAALKEHGGQA